MTFTVAHFDPNYERMIKNHNPKSNNQIWFNVGLVHKWNYSLYRCSWRTIHNSLPTAETMCSLSDWSQDEVVWLDDLGTMNKHGSRSPRQSSKEVFARDIAGGKVNNPSDDDQAQAGVDTSMAVCGARARPGHSYNCRLSPLTVWILWTGTGPPSYWAAVLLWW